jgi:hypothetical protein
MQSTAGLNDWIVQVAQQPKEVITKPHCISMSLSIPEETNT